MRLLLGILAIVLTTMGPAEAGGRRDGYSTSTRCRCDRSLNPHYTSRGYAARGSYRDVFRRGY